MKRIMDRIFLGNCSLLSARFDLVDGEVVDRISTVGDMVDYLQGWVDHYRNHYPQDMEVGIDDDYSIHISSADYEAWAATQSYEDRK